MSELRLGPPPAQGLYDPRHEHDACGVGFVVDIKGGKSHDIVVKALDVLKNLLHRGACGCEPNTGDGAGILLQMPDKFLRRECARLGITLAGPGRVRGGPGVLAPRPGAAREGPGAAAGDRGRGGPAGLLGWRDVPTDDRPAGRQRGQRRARHPADLHRARGPAVRDHAHFERKLYVIRKRFEHAIAALDFPEKKLSYLPSLSSNTLIYKGMLSADQIETMFPDITDPDVESALALVHQRFSTNTFPSWPLAHPYRYIAHNGEINTLRGNINWMRAREALCQLGPPRRGPREGAAGHPRGPHRLGHVRQRPRVPGDERPLAAPRDPDDDPGAVAEPRGHEPRAAGLLRVSRLAHGALGRPRLHRLHRRHRHRRRPGPQRPAPLALLRHQGRPGDHGLRGRGARHPAREHAPQGAAAPRPHLPGRHRAGPDHRRRGDQGRAGRRASLRRVAPAQHRVRWTTCRPRRSPSPTTTPCSRARSPSGTRTRICGLLLAPMARQGEEPLGSMGTDTALAVLSDRSRPLYDYFKQLFAQVTNPPLDQIREELVTSMESTIGPERNLLGPSRSRAGRSCSRTRSSPTRSSPSSATWPSRGFKAITLPMLYPVAEGAAGLERALGDLQGAGQPGDRRGPQRRDPLRPRRHSRARGDPEPAGHRRRPPSSRPPGRAHAVRARRRDRRRARGAPHVPAHRVRGGRREPVGRLRDARRHDPRGPADRPRSPEGRAQLHQGAQQGDPQGHGQDGDLDAAELLRRADLRGHRPEPRRSSTATSPGPRRG